MGFRPLGDRVLIQKDEAPTKTAGGLLLPENAQKQPSRGVVIECGPGAVVDGEVLPLNVTIGDKVLFGQWAGTEIKISGETFWIMKEADIFGVILD